MAGVERQMTRHGIAEKPAVCGRSGGKGELEVANCIGELVGAGMLFDRHYRDLNLSKGIREKY